MSEELIDTIETGNVERLAELLAAGADPNATVISRYYTLEERLTPLLVAVRELQPPGDQEPGKPIDAVVLLLRHGADVNRWDEEHGSTPLLTAVLANHIEAVRILLAAGADPNVCGGEGDSPLRFCAESGLLEMARLLLHCGAGKTLHEGQMLDGAEPSSQAITAELPSPRSAAQYFPGRAPRPRPPSEGQPTPSPPPPEPGHTGRDIYEL